MKIVKMKDWSDLPAGLIVAIVKAVTSHQAQEIFREKEGYSCTKAYKCQGTFFMVIESGHHS